MFFLKYPLHYPKEEFILNEKVYRNLDQIEEKTIHLYFLEKAKWH